MAQQEALELGEVVRREVHAHAPPLAQEIEAIARGAGRTSAELFALNGRSEPSCPNARAWASRPLQHARALSF